MDSLKKNIKNLINEKNKISNGSNGHYVVDLKNLIKCDLLELNNILNELYKENFVVVKKGINGTLIMKK